MKIKPIVPVGTVIKESFLVSGITVYMDKKSDEGSIFLNYTLQSLKDIHDTTEVPECMIKIMLEDALTSSEIINIKNGFSPNETVYKKFCNRIVPGIITSILYNGKSCDYSVQFADEDVETFHREKTICLHQKDIKYCEDIAGASEEEY